MQLASKIDPARWGILKNQKPAWRVRAKAAAKMIETPGAVLDLGCGNMLIERFLPRGRKYIPVDGTQRDERTIVCDFNNGPLPTVEGCGVVIVLDVLEHLQRPKDFLAALSPYRAG